MNDENRYQAYQYGMPQEPQPEEPKSDESKQEEMVNEQAAYVEGAYEEVQPEEQQFEDPKMEKPQFAEPDLEQAKEESYAPRYDYTYSEPQGGANVPQKEKKAGCFGKAVVTIALAIVFGIVASVVFQGTNRLANAIWGPTDNYKTDTKVDSTQISTNAGTTVKSDVADVAESVMPSVVSITNMSIQEVQNFFFGGVTQYESQSSGSGIIIGQNDAELLIVTNNHVVEGSKTLTVTFIDDTSMEAQIKGTDSDMDLAIIAVPLNSIEKDTLEDIKVATLGDSDAIRVGEPTIAIGNALGYGQSVTTGIVSALERTIEDFEGELIQTDAAINPGNSGGALLNANGEVIGINTAKVSADAVEGMGYAIPISDVTDILNELMNKETRTKVPESERGVIGIMGRTVDASTSEYYGMPEGVYVTEIVEGGGADKAKLPAGCVITEIDDYDVDSMEELQEQLTYYRAGETVEFTIEIGTRGGYEEETIEITLQKAK